MRTHTTAKTIRIPNDTLTDIEETAKHKNVSFSKEAVNRLRQRDDTPVPAILAKTQTIINLTREGKTKEAQKEMNQLWERISILSK